MEKINLRESFPEFFEVRNMGVDFRKGWSGILEGLFTKMRQEVTKGAAQPDILQIKEKFGGLRVYISSGNDKMHEFIREAEKASFRTCEICGDLGLACTSKSGWLKTLCKKHMEEFDYERVN